VLVDDVDHLVVELLVDGPRLLLREPLVRLLLEERLECLRDHRAARVEQAVGARMEVLHHHPDQHVGISLPHALPHARCEP
jgi:hypothetical protein